MRQPAVMRRPAATRRPDSMGRPAPDTRTGAPRLLWPLRVRRDGGDGRAVLEGASL